MGSLKTHAAALLCILLVTGFFALQVRRIENLRQTHPQFSEEMWNAMPNNGKTATAFAVHITPHHIFSEDFHLYYLRARRIARFGFVDNILEPSRSRRLDFRNLIQVIVCLPMAVLGHAISHYALLIWFYLSLAYAFLYAVHFRLFKNPISSLLVCLAIFMILGFRGLRVSTYMLSTPVLVVGFLSLILRLVMNNSREVTPRELFPLTGTLVALELWDVWSFLFLFFAAVIFAIYYTIVQFTVSRQEAFKKLISTVKIFCIAVAPVLVAVIINKPLHIDLLRRAGFFVSDGLDLRYLEPADTLKTVLMCAAGIVLLRGVKSKFSAVFMLLFLSFSAVCGFAIFGLQIEPYALSHFYILFKVVCLWWLYACVFWPAPLAFQKLLNNVFASAVWRRLVYAVCLGLFFYTGFTFYNFNSQERYGEFAIPQKYEELVQYLNSNVRNQKGRSLLTLSHELNLLLAYHTDFDLLLPEGFPLHTSKTNQEIFDRMAAVSHFLGISPLHWELFLKPGTPQAEFVWLLNRELSESASYLYYLFHRYGSGRHFKGGEGQDQGEVLKRRLCNEVTNNQTVLSEPPDFVVSEGVFKILNLQPPPGYSVVFEYENVTLYQKKV